MLIKQYGKQYMLINMKRINFSLSLILLILVIQGCVSVSNEEKELLITRSEQLLKLDSSKCKELVNPMLDIEECLRLVKFNKQMAENKFYVDSVWADDVPNNAKVLLSYMRKFGIRYRCNACPSEYTTISFFFVQDFSEKLVFYDFIFNYPQKHKIYNW